MLQRFDWNKTKQIDEQMGRNNGRIVPGILTQKNCFDPKETAINLAGRVLPLLVPPPLIYLCLPGCLFVNWAARNDYTTHR